jgi:hypothetical protein
MNSRETLAEIFRFAVALDGQLPQERLPSDLRSFKHMVDDLGRSGQDGPDERRIAEVLGAMSPHDYEDPNLIARALAPLGRDKQEKAFSKCGVTLQFPDNPWKLKLHNFTP